MANRWQWLVNVAGAANRFRMNGEAVRIARFERAEFLRIAMNDECANRPYDAHSHAFCEGKLWPVIPGEFWFD